MRTFHNRSATGGTWPRLGWLALLIACAGLLAGASAATTASAQGLNARGQIVVDAARSQVFATFGPGSPGVGVFDLNGNRTATLALPDAEGLALLGGVLYAAPCQGDEVARFDAATLQPMTPVTITGMTNGSCSLTTAGGRVWFYWWTQHELVAISSDGTHQAFSGVGIDQPAHLYGVSGTRLLEDGTPGELVELDVSTATPTVALTKPYPDTVWDAAPIGSTGDVLMATYPGELRRLAISDLHQKLTYGTISTPTMAAASADGSLVGGLDAGSSGVFAEAFPAASTDATFREPAGGQAIAFGPGDRLYLTAGEGLTVFTDVSLRSSQVSVLPDTYSPHVGLPMGIHGALSFLSETTPGVQTLDVTADGPDGAHADLGQITTAADGTYSGQVSIPSPGSWTITATYAGDGAHRPSHAATSPIQFVLSRAGLKVALSSHVITYGRQITLRIKLDGWHTNTIVELSRKSPGIPRVDLGPIDLGSDGIATLTVKPGRNSTYRAVSVGDDWYSPSTSNEPPVGVHVVVRNLFGGGYAVRHGVRLYHYASACARRGRRCPIIYGTVIPNHAGKTVVFVLEVHTRSGWKSGGTGSFRIPKSGTARAILVYRSRAVIGVLQRFRAVFQGDADHLDGHGPWKQFRITS